jgi:nicotinate-nucleotide--dimethylbenzimidazole phosphoribosyltransferase
LRASQHLINVPVNKSLYNGYDGKQFSLADFKKQPRNNAPKLRIIPIGGLGEMGIGNTSPSSVWMHLLTGISLEQCVGAGSGLDSEGIRHKYNVLKQSVDHYAGDGSAKDIIAWFGGYEMVMAIGGMLRAAELRMIILVDGFIMTNCILAASKLHPEVLSYAIFGHQGDETGHKLVLDAMKVRPLLNLGLRLGEGTGAICAYPIVVSSVNMMNEMDNFAHASITKYF